MYKMKISHITYRIFIVLIFLGFNTRLYATNESLRIGKDVDISSILAKENMHYIIQYDYDLKGKTVIIGANSVVEFQGGKIKNCRIGGESITFCGVVKLESVTLTNNCLKDKNYFLDWFDDVVGAFEMLASLPNQKSIVFGNHSYYIKGNRRIVLKEPILLTGRENTTITIDGKLQIVQNANLAIDNIIFSWVTPNKEPFIIGFNSHSTRFSNIGWKNGGTMCVMGSENEKAFNLKIENSRTLALADIGAPFIELRNGAGFYWKTFDEIHYVNQSLATPEVDYTRKSRMNVKEGTDVIDITGSWDTGDICFFAEKVYDAIRVSSKSKSRITVQNINVHDCMFDFCRGCGIRVNSDFTTLTGWKIVNNYIGSWEDAAISVSGKSGTYFIESIIDKTFVPYTGTYGFFFNTLNSSISKCKFTNNIFLKISRLSDKSYYPAMYFTFIDNCQITGNTAKLDNSMSQLNWAVLGELRAMHSYGSNIVSENIFNSINWDPLGLGRDRDEVQIGNKSLLTNNHVVQVNDNCRTYQQVFALPTDFWGIPKSNEETLNPFACKIQLFFSNPEAINGLTLNKVKIPIVNNLELGPNDTFSISYSENPKIIVRVLN